MSKVDEVVKLALTPQEAATALAISTTQLYNLIRTGQLRGFHIGRSHRIAVAELERFVAALVAAEP